MITVGVPTYNRAEHLVHALESILGQTFEDFEVVVCDDGSTDGTPKVVESFEDDRITYIRSPSNLRIPGVLNRILEASLGQAIVMLHDHDRFTPDLLEGMVAALARDERVGFVNPRVAWEDLDGGRYEVMPPLVDRVMAGSALVEQMLLGPSFACPVTACALVRRTAYEAVGFQYDPQFGFLADVDMWLRLAARFDVGQVERVGLVCRRRDENHPMSDAAWDLGRLIVAIHQVNVERYFAGRPPALARARRTLRRKEVRLYSQMLGSAASHGDKELFHHGLTVVKGIGGLPGVSARSLGRFPVLEGALLDAGAWAGDIRHRLRGSERVL